MKNHVRHTSDRPKRLLRAKVLLPLFAVLVLAALAALYFLLFPASFDGSGASYLALLPEESLDGWLSPKGDPAQAAAAALTETVAHEEKREELPFFLWGRDG